MTSGQKSSRQIPIIVGVICALIGAGYAYFVFHAGQTNPAPNVTAGAPVAPATVPANVPAANTQRVRIGSFSTAIDYAPMIVARSKGWITEALGLPANQVEFTTFQTLPTINEAFAADKLDVVFEAEVPAIVGRAAGIDIQITALGATLNEGILVRSDLSISSIRGLKGHSVAVLAGTAMQFGLVNLVKAAGIDLASVKQVNMVPPDAAAAFSSHQIDAWAVWPPWPEQQAISKAGRFIPESNCRVQSVVVMRGGFIRSGTAAPNVIAAIRRAKVWLAANPAEGATLVAKELGLPEEVVKLAWPKHDWAAELTPEVTHDIGAKAAFLLDQKMIQRPVNLSELVNPLSGKQ